MSFVTAIKTCFSKYATFSGRALRSEYWYFQLFLILSDVLLNAVLEPVSFFFSIIVFMPGLAVTVRRFHDIGKSGWWFPIVMLPFLSWILGGVVLESVSDLRSILRMVPEAVSHWIAMNLEWLAVAYLVAMIACLVLMLVWMARKGQPGDNRFGPPPLPKVSS